MSTSAGLAIGDRPADPASLHTPVRELVARLCADKPRTLGFPVNLAFDLSDAGYLLSTLTNNAGDPGAGDDAKIHTKPFERAVLDWFTDLAGGDSDSAYGYVTHSGSEGVLHGLHTGRHHLPHAPVYASAEAHYCVAKAARLLRMELVTVPCLPGGAMDPGALESLCRRRRRRDLLRGRRPRGAVVLATIGATMSGAVDDLPMLRRAAAVAGGVHVHSDAALGGLVAAFSPSRQAWNLAHGADSVSLSGHKLLGSPLPCGVFLTHRALVPPAPVGAYLGAPDHTLGCSRSGAAAALLWLRLRQLGTQGMREMVLACQRVAAHAHAALTRAGARPHRGPDSLVVTFDRPPRAVCERWHLATQRDRAHLIAMPHVTREAVDALCAQIAER